MDGLRRFVFLTDLHWGYENVRGRKKPLHDTKAIDLALRFLRDFDPHEIILGGDILDCSAISHHNDRKPGRVEGLRLTVDSGELRRDVLSPLEELPGTERKLIFIKGNHEAWLDQLIEKVPGLEGVMEAEHLLQLKEHGWKVIPQGGHYQLGKLWFVHGDQLSSGEHCAKNAVVKFKRNLRFGHFHTHQAFTDISPVDQWPHVACAVPCLCSRSPHYGKGAANKWVQGFLYGWVGDNGVYSDYVVRIVKGRMVIDGKIYS